MREIFFILHVQTPPPYCLWTLRRVNFFSPYIHHQRREAVPSVAPISGFQQGCTILEQAISFGHCDVIQAAHFQLMKSCGRAFPVQCTFFWGPPPLFTQGESDPVAQLLYFQKYLCPIVQNIHRHEYTRPF